MWQPVEQTEKRKQQLASYKIDPPFQTKYTPRTAPPRPAKKQMPGQNPRSLAPWAHGTVQIMKLLKMSTFFNVEFIGFFYQTIIHYS